MLHFYCLLSNNSCNSNHNSNYKFYLIFLIIFTFICLKKYNKKRNKGDLETNTTIEHLLNGIYLHLTNVRVEEKIASNDRER